MAKIVCPGCREELDKVVLSFGTRSWDERTQSYIHTEEDEEGDWACPKCGATVSETRFYPPAAGRPVPKTYGDWVSLAENIKGKYPDDPVMRATVNYQLGIIAREGEVEPVVEEEDVDEAKRWLAEKAGDLGIT